MPRRRDREPGSERLPTHPPLYEIARCREPGASLTVEQVGASPVHRHVTRRAALRRCQEARRSSRPSIWWRTKMSSSVDSRAAARTRASRNAVIVRVEIMRPMLTDPCKHPPHACSGARAVGPLGGPGAVLVSTYRGNTCLARSAANSHIAPAILSALTLRSLCARSYTWRWGRGPGRRRPRPRPPGPSSRAARQASAARWSRARPEAAAARPPRRPAPPPRRVPPRRASAGARAGARTPAWRGPARRRGAPRQGRAPPANRRTAWPTSR
jgi:hypothetical protein